MKLSAIVTNFLGENIQAKNCHLRNKQFDML